VPRGEDDPFLIFRGGDDQIFDVTQEAVFFALPALLFIGTAVWAVVTDDPIWVRVLSPFLMFVLGNFASLVLVIVGMLLETYAPFWQRGFWRRSR